MKFRKTHHRKWVGHNWNTTNEFSAPIADAASGFRVCTTFNDTTCQPYISGGASSARYVANNFYGSIRYANIWLRLMVTVELCSGVRSRVTAVMSATKYSRANNTTKFTANPRTAHATAAITTQFRHFTAASRCVTHAAGTNRLSSEPKTRCATSFISGYIRMLRSNLRTTSGAMVNLS